MTSAMLDTDQVPAAVKLAAQKHITEDTIAWFAVPFDPGSASINKRSGSHWSRRHADTETAHLAAAWSYRMAGDPTNALPVTVDVIVLRGRVMDDDGIISGLKGVRDYIFGRRFTEHGAAAGRMAIDDGPRWMRWGKIHQITGAIWNGPSAWTILCVRLRDSKDA